MFGFRLVMVDGAQAARPVRPMSERPNDTESRGTFQQLRELARCATGTYKYSMKLKEKAFTSLMSQALQETVRIF